MKKGYESPSGKPTIPGTRTFMPKAPVIRERGEYNIFALVKAGNQRKSKKWVNRIHHKIGEWGQQARSDAKNWENLRSKGRITMYVPAIRVIGKNIALNAVSLRTTSFIWFDLSANSIETFAKYLSLLVKYGKIARWHHIELRRGPNRDTWCSKSREFRAPISASDCTAARDRWCFEGRERPPELFFQRRLAPWGSPW